MDFLKKKMKELMDDNDKDKPKKDEHLEHHGERGPLESYNSSQQHQSHAPGLTTGPPAPYGAPPPMPPGWIIQWDQNSQRWYYLEQATGRTQWDPPAASPAPPGPFGPPPGHTVPYGGTQHGHPPGPGHDGDRAMFGNTHGYPQGDSHGYGHGDAHEKEHKEKKKGPGYGMVAAAGLGGLAAGGLIGHEMTEDSDDEKHYAAAGPVPTAAPAYMPAGEPAFAPPPPVPTHDEDGDSISSSDRESLEEKREEMVEAQEEYEEELEDAYDD